MVIEIFCIFHGVFLSAKCRLGSRHFKQLLVIKKLSEPVHISFIYKRVFGILLPPYLALPANLRVQASSLNCARVKGLFLKIVCASA